MAHQRQIDPPNYNVKDTFGQPVLNLLRPVTNAAGDTSKFLRIFHNDLNAIIWRTEQLDADGKVTKENVSFREFSVFFHDELKTFYTRNFTELQKFDQLAGVRDGFGINYGASGMGAMLLANRKGIGPAADCMECLYEEFFLQSWANGDPALLENYPDDPSNVHHSYLNDPVVYRNFHAGPKETHVFHLHAHQWFSGNDGGRGSYLDSQTVGPQQGFSYDIYHGGLTRYEPSENVSYPPGYQKPKGKGWWGSLGAGNRNRSPGDSIFHCHLYPHFAQGMWELWRNHDVLEDGSRLLPDGQAKAELVSKHGPRSRRSCARHICLQRAAAQTRKPGQLPMTRARQFLALFPLPDKAAPLLPTYGKPACQATPSTLKVNPDIARLKRRWILQEHRALWRNRCKWQISGWWASAAYCFGRCRSRIWYWQTVTLRSTRLPSTRKNLSQYAAKMLALADMTAHLTTAKLKLLPYNGSELELRGMGFHYNGKIWDDNTGGQDLDLKTAHGAKADYLPNVWFLSIRRHAQA